MGLKPALAGPFGPYGLTIFYTRRRSGDGMICQLLPAASVGAARKNLTRDESQMTWTTPVFEEVVLCCEINSYISAKL